MTEPKEEFAHLPLINIGPQRQCTQVPNDQFPATARSYLGWPMCGRPISKKCNEHEYICDGHWEKYAEGKKRSEAAKKAVATKRRKNREWPSRKGQRNWPVRLEVKAFNLDDLHEAYLRAVDAIEKVPADKAAAGACSAPENKYYYSYEVGKRITKKKGGV